MPGDVLLLGQYFEFAAFQGTQVCLLALSLLLVKT